jgi:predicted nucleotidyltransferase
MQQDKSRTLQAPDRQLPASIPAHIASIIQQFALDAKTLLRGNLIAEYLFGSYAKNTYTSLSDIDMLFLVKTFSPEIRRQLSGLASDYSLEYDVYISPIIKDRQVWDKNQQYNTLFFQEVMQHGIPL